MDLGGKKEVKNETGKKGKEKCVRVKLENERRREKRKRKKKVFLTSAFPLYTVTSLLEL